MTMPQPSDEWDFLPSDDEPPARPRRYAEVDAIHVIPLEPAPRLQDVAVPAPAAPGPRRYFADEEPEEPPAPRQAADDVEPDLEHLLESQHYSFGSDR